MKLYFLAGLIVIILAALVLLSPGQVVSEDQPTTQVAPTANVLVTDGVAFQEKNDEKPTNIVPFDVFVVDDEFSPTVMYVNEGDTVRLTFATGHERPKDSDVEVAFDFTLEDFGIVSYVDTAQEIEFVADKVGEFPYYCLTCSPQISGTLVVN